VARLLPVLSRPNHRIAQTAQLTISRRQQLAIVGAIMLLAVMLFINLTGALVILVGAVTAIYLVNCLIRMLFAGMSLQRSALQFTERELEQARIDAPAFTAMIPIRREGLPILQRLATTLTELDYPADKLQIILLLDDDEEETIANAMLAMPDNVLVLAIDAVAPRTKPRVLNDGLRHATGEYVVVWDVEDAPEPQQLLKAVAAFRQAAINDPTVVCLQAQLAFDPSLVEKPNALTRWQAASYNFHFRLLLPALDRLGLPVPLGGTSNFFKTEAIRELGGWDAWNVTEDLDLGIRIARRGWKVRMIDSTTWEEPNPLLGNCVRQWSRWKKGAMQTYLVHMRHPRQLLRDLGIGRFLSFQFTVGAPPLILLLNPILMVMSFLYWVVGAEWVSTLFPTPVLYAGNFCLIAGNLFFIFAIATASLHRKQFGLVPTALFSIFHWILMIVSAYKAFWQLITKRSHHWEVTQHGHASTILTSGAGFGSSAGDVAASKAA
jgi:cellulose synthase/poly-beta-1,6-N-acetylglucosamine synthase-like glycosyltransferase